MARTRRAVTGPNSTVRHERLDERAWTLRAGVRYGYSIVGIAVMTAISRIVSETDLRKSLANEASTFHPSRVSIALSQRAFSLVKLFDTFAHPVKHCKQDVKMM